MALPLVDVAAGIVWRGGRFLAAQRPAGKPHAGFWEFPGGKVEAGESPEAALGRELAEELGIEVIGSRLWGVKEHSYARRGIRVRLHFFEVLDYGGQVVAREGQALAWIRPSEASAYRFLPADTAIARALQCPAPGAPPGLEGQSHDA